MYAHMVGIYVCSRGEQLDTHCNKKLQVAFTPQLTLQSAFDEARQQMRSEQASHDKWKTQRNHTQSRKTRGEKVDLCMYYLCTIKYRPIEKKNGLLCEKYIVLFHAHEFEKKIVSLQ